MKYKNQKNSCLYVPPKRLFANCVLRIYKKSSR